MTKTLDTLVEDMMYVLDSDTDHTPSEENLEKLAQDVVTLMKTRLAKREQSTDALRFSALGKKDRQIWHIAKGTPGEKMTPNTYMKFLYGDIIELVVLFLAKESGHIVENEQGEVEVEGVKGHIDALIDGKVVDVKSASPFGFQKFKNHKLLEDDPFGYVQQLSGYSNVLTPGESPSFLAVDKVTGNMHVMELDTSITAAHPPLDRIQHLKKIIASEIPPNLCYDPVPDGKSGNMKLATGCAYCQFKNSCFPGLRTFIYSNGPRYLTTVVKVPDVYEATGE